MVNIVFNPLDVEFEGGGRSYAPMHSSPARDFVDVIAFYFALVLLDQRWVLWLGG